MRTRKAFVIAGLCAFLVVVAVHFLQFPGSVPDFNRALCGRIISNQQAEIDQMKAKLTKLKD